MGARTLVVAMVLSVGFAVSANAFTYDNRTNQNPDGSARFTDPDSALGKRSSGDSHFSMHFSGGGPGGQTSSDDRFVPSSNGVFSSPFNGPNNMDLALGNRHW